MEHIKLFESFVALNENVGDKIAEECYRLNSLHKRTKNRTLEFDEAVEELAKRFKIDSSEMRKEFSKYLKSIGLTKNDLPVLFKEMKDKKEAATKAAQEAERRRVSDPRYAVESGTTYGIYTEEMYTSFMFQNPTPAQINKATDATEKGLSDLEGVIEIAKAGQLHVEAEKLERMESLMDSGRKILAKLKAH